MIFEVSNKIKVENPTSELTSWCFENLIIENPDYYKKQRMGLWCGNVPQHLALYERDGNNLYLPYGCLMKLYSMYKDDSVFYTGIRKRGEAINYQSCINLYPYQEKAVTEALRRKNGIIVMPCGSGKTQTALEIISRIGGKCLWLTHTQDLLNQSLNRAKSTLNINSNSYGTITGGKVNIGTGITFATVQTMSKIDLHQFRDSWDVIIVDECHKAVGSPTKAMQFYKVLSNISCRYKIGLTATPKRADGLETMMFALIGDMIYEVSRGDVANTTCPVKVRFVNTRYSPNLDLALSGDGTINYAGLVDDITHNNDRFYDVVSESVRTAMNGPTIVLANRVEYLLRMTDVMEKAGVEAVCLSSMGNSKAAKAQRKEVLNRLNNGDIGCVLATYQLAKEGLDVPNLRHVVFATPEKDETTVMQAAGRVGRKADGKEFGEIIDFVDSGFGMFRGWAKKREGYYKKLGYTVL